MRGRSLAGTSLAAEEILVPASERRRALMQLDSMKLNPYSGVDWLPHRTPGRQGNLGLGLVGNGIQWLDLHRQILF
jgi:hypothetical protein